MSKVTKDIMERQIVSATGYTREVVRDIYKVFLHLLRENIEQGDTVKLKGVGSFEVRIKKKQKGYNPALKKVTDIPAKNVLKFTVAPSLKSTLKEQDVE